MQAGPNRASYLRRIMVTGMHAAPPTELAVHPADGEPVADRSWGLATTLVLPGGERIGLYQTRHASPLAT